MWNSKKIRGPSKNRPRVSRSTQPKSSYGASYRSSVGKAAEQEEVSVSKVVASATEQFLAKKFAPALLSKRGKSSIIFIYLMLICCAVYGISKVEIAFGVEYFINEDSKIYDYMKTEKEYFRSGLKPNTFWDNPIVPEMQIEEITFGSEESQLTLLEFNDRLARC